MSGLSTEKGCEISLSILCKLLCSYPDLPEELIDLLRSLDEGEAACLDALEPDSLKVQLTQWLQSLGVVEGNSPDDVS